jgi:hypothetical protein
MRLTEEVAIACRMRANYIETGDVNLSLVDVQERLGSRTSWPGSVREALQSKVLRTAGLSQDQRDLVAALRRQADIISGGP